MDRSKVTRREFLRSLGIAAGAATLAGCAPQVVKETVIVEKPVEKIVEKVVKETVIVEGTPQVVEKVITVAAPPAEPVTVTFWHVWGGTRTPLLREVLDNFEALNPGIKVEDTVQDGKTDTQKILTAMAAGSPPDLAMTHTWDVPMWAYKKSVIPTVGRLRCKGWHRSLRCVLSSGCGRLHLRRQAHAATVQASHPLDDVLQQGDLGCEGLG